MQANMNDHFSLGIARGINQADYGNALQFDESDQRYIIGGLNSTHSFIGDSHEDLDVAG